MKIAVAQINSIIGDIQGNKLKILESYRKGINDGADLVVCPELSLTGYPPLDLVEKQEFRNAARDAAEEIAKSTGPTGLLFGSITEEQEVVGTGVYNSAVFCSDGEVKFIQNKTLIPNYDVFDEMRYFESARENCILDFKGMKLGISVCEDIWNDVDFWKKRRYDKDPIENLIRQGAEIILNISASPYAFGKRLQRLDMLSHLASTEKIPVVYVCAAGAQTDLIFDGASMCIDKGGRLCMLGRTFQTDYFIFDTLARYEEVTEVEGPYEKEIIDALILGIRDYAEKTGFKKALIGLSGGIDSAIVTYLAVEALGSENVHTVLMPSEFSSRGSIDDSLKLIDILGISYSELSIQPVFDKIREVLSGEFRGLNEDVTEENIQPRIRGMYLMALSNKLGYLLLTTGNKSEMAVGYCTLYGDMCGALAVIADVYKTDIYRLSRYINREKEIIPEEIILKAPSAELRHGQTDQDSLPPYDILDRILKMYLEENKELQQISSETGDYETVRRTLRLVDLNEFKRKQAAPALRVSTKAFGYGRRFPIVQKWRTK